MRRASSDMEDPPFSQICRTLFQSLRASPASIRPRSRGCKGVAVEWRQDRNPFMLRLVRIWLQLLICDMIVHRVPFQGFQYLILKPCFFPLAST